MSIEFSEEMWKKVRENYSLWWEGKLERPLIHLTVTDKVSNRSPSKFPFKSITAAYDKLITSEEIVDSWDYMLSTQSFFGDAFPSVWLNFGPGVLSAFLGAELECDQRTVWFYSQIIKEISELNFKLDNNNYWFKRVKSIADTANKRFEGAVQIGMTDLGGVMDILSTFRPSERLLFDLYDNPNEVKQLTWQISQMWWRAFDEINTILNNNPGYSCWTPIFSDKPYYMTQSDFSFMISPEMFDEFVKPELKASLSRLANGFYHLDGPGEIPHLDSLLQMDELKGIQWIPGDGQPPPEEWPEIYRRIRKAGKLIQVFGNKSGFKTLDKIVEDLGSGKGIIFIHSIPSELITEAKDFLKRYGCDNH